MKDPDRHFPSRIIFCDARALTMKLFVSGGTAFPCVHIRPAELVVDVHYSLVVDLVPRDPPLGYNISTPSARYLPPLNYLTGATWMAHPWKLHLETIVHAVQAPKLGSHGVDICLPDGEYTPVIRLFTTRAHTGLTGGHPSDMIEIGLRWYLTDHSFVKASLPGAEQPVLFRARRPLSSQYQQSGVMPTVRSPAPSYMYLHNTGGVSAVPRGHLTVVASNADLPANANHVPTERCHSYLKTRWLLSSEESRNENLLTTPSAISGSVYNTLSSKSSSVIYTPESFASGSSMNASSVFSEEIARSSSALTKNSSAPFMSEDPALVNLFNSFFPQGFFDDDHRHHPP
ncbi:uncharacterized protein LOC111268605 isoform X2 [Varroa jacobsoni]|uniref:Uncharacterized protein n=1 Tax=Varroa destructor TaxID=109461 RepID=A0A7M7KDT0_VARDE|nr:uncharacterized protein LOC111251875 isoform X2 [Varroa destructor]XP_022703414.1 uncharacterized protein LOC111268605 isoform X2 [Varroa jacobsoni]